MINEAKLFMEMLRRKRYFLRKKKANLTLEVTDKVRLKIEASLGKTTES